MSEALFGFGIGLVLGVISSRTLISYDGYKAGFQNMKKIALKEFNVIQIKYNEKCDQADKLLRQAEVDKKRMDDTIEIFLEYMIDNKEQERKD